MLKKIVNETSFGKYDFVYLRIGMPFLNLLSLPSKLIAFRFCEQLQVSLLKLPATKPSCSMFLTFRSVGYAFINFEDVSTRHCPCLKPDLLNSPSRTLSSKFVSISHEKSTEADTVAVRELQSGPSLVREPSFFLTPYRTSSHMLLGTVTIVTKLLKSLTPVRTEAFGDVASSLICYSHPGTRLPHSKVPQ